MFLACFGTFYFLTKVFSRCFSRLYCFCVDLNLYYYDNFILLFDGNIFYTSCFRHYFMPYRACFER